MICFLHRQVGRPSGACCSIFPSSPGCAPLRGAHPELFPFDRSAVLFVAIGICGALNGARIEIAKQQGRYCCVRMLENSMVDACPALVPDAVYIEKIGRNIVRTH